jgi:hypothetical protein
MLLRLANAAHLALLSLLRTKIRTFQVVLSGDRGVHDRDVFQRYYRIRWHYSPPIFLRRTYLGATARRPS